MLSIENDGSNIRATNFWQTPFAAAGAFYLSVNANAFRLLVPDSQKAAIQEISTAREVIVSRGPWPAKSRADAIELLFEDGTDTPFTLHFGVEQIDRLPLDSDAGHQLMFSAWTKGPVKVLTRPARYRRVAAIPCLEPWRPIH